MGARGARCKRRVSIIASPGGLQCGPPPCLLAAVCAPLPTPLPTPTPPLLPLQFVEAEYEKTDRLIELFFRSVGWPAWLVCLSVGCFVVWAFGQ